MSKLVVVKSKNQYVFMEEFAVKSELVPGGEIYTRSIVSEEQGIGVAFDKEDQIVVGLFPPSMKAKYEAETKAGYESCGFDYSNVEYVLIKDANQTLLDMLACPDPEMRNKAFFEVGK